MRWFIILSIVILPNLVRSQPLVANFSATPVSGCPPLVVTFNDQSTGNPTYWKWDLGNGTISYQQRPTATYFSPGNYSVTLVIKNATGSDSITRSQLVQVNALPTANFAAVRTSGCAPLRVQLTDSSIAGSGNIVSWQWDFGDGSSSTQQSPMHTYTSPGTFTVTLWVTNSNGCVKILSRPSYISVSDGVSPNFSHSYTPACTSPATVNFTNNSAGTGTLSYLWDFGDGTYSTQPNPVHNYLNAGNYSPKLIINSSNGCTDTLLKANLLNIQFPKAGFSTPAILCEDLAYTFTNTSSPTGGNATWSFGDGTYSNAINPQKAYSTGGIYQVKLVNQFGACKDSMVQNLTITAKPIPDFTSANSIGCKAPFTTNFSNTSTGANYYLWRFGDGITSTNTQPTYTYQQSGHYTVTMIATNSAGCSDSVTKVDFIKIVPPKITAITNLPANGCLPFTVTPLAVVQTLLPVTSYLWDFGDGNTSTLSNPSHTYTTPGSFDIKLIVTTGAGCSDTLIMNDAVKAGNKPIADFAAAPRDTCSGTVIFFNDLSSGAPATAWLWNFGDGGTSRIKNPVHQYYDTGWFSLSLVVHNFGCADTATKMQYLRSNPPVAGFDTAFFCNDRLTRHFIDKSVGALTWRWDFGDGDTSDLQAPSHTYALPGIYTVTQEVANGGCKQTFVQSVKVVNEVGNLTVSDSITCRNSRITLGVQNIDVNNIQQFSWFFYGLQGVPTITANTPVAFSYPTAGVNPATVIIQDVLGCIDTLITPLPITVYGPTAGVVSTPIEACYNSAITFLDSSSTDGIHPISQWTWNYGDGNMQTYTAAPFQHTYNTPGIFNIQVTVVDDYGCRDSVTKHSLVSVFKPIANFITTDTFACPNSAVKFIDQSISLNGNYSWSFGDGNTSTGTNVVHQYASTGVYSVGLKITSPQGCIDSTVKNNYIVVDRPMANFSVSDSLVCQPIQVSFKDSSHYTSKWLWNFGNGNVSVLKNPVNVFATSQIYNVKLTVTSPGGCVDSAFKKIKVSLLTASLSYGPLQGCSPVPVTLNASSSRPMDLIWNFGDGTSIIGNNSSLIHHYTSPGKYLPQVIMSDTTGCVVPVSGIDTIRIEQIFAKFGADVHFLCDSGTVNFRDSSTSAGPVTYKWYFGDGGTSTLKNPSHKYLQPGNYTVKLVVTSPLGCGDSITYPNFITIDRTVTPSVSIQATSTNICEGTAVTFSAATINGGSTPLFQWKINGNDVGTNSNTFTSTTILNSDTVSCEFVSSARCVSNPMVMSNKIRMVVNKYVTPDVTVNASSTSVCAGNPITFIGVPANGGTQPLYRWQVNGNSVSSNNTFTSNSLKNGDSVNCMLTSNAVCTTTPTAISKSIPVTVHPYPVVDAGPNTLVLDGWRGPLQPTIIGINPAVKWLPSTYLNSDTSFYPLCTPLQDIKYKLVVTGIGGCTSSDEVFITVFKLRIPNVFSPNADGINDTWLIEGLKSFSDATVEVFNRNGTLIFRSVGYRKPWDGTVNGSKLPVGTYYYIVDVKSQGVKPSTGSVTILK